MTRPNRLEVCSQESRAMAFASESMPWDSGIQGGGGGDGPADFIQLSWRWKRMDELLKSNGVLFMMLGAVMIFAMHGGFAFLEVGSVRQKSQVNALVKILSDWSVSTVVYFLIGFPHQL